MLQNMRVSLSSPSHPRRSVKFWSSTQGKGSPPDASSWVGGIEETDTPNVPAFAASTQPSCGFTLNGQSTQFITARPAGSHQLTEAGKKKKREKKKRKTLSTSFPSFLYAAHPLLTLENPLCSSPEIWESPLLIIFFQLKTRHTVSLSLLLSSSLLLPRSAFS